jgi:methyl-accepting chemotaxis protein
VQLSQTTQQNASSSEELAATAEEMSSQAQQLQQSMAFFRLQHGATARAAATVVASAARGTHASKRESAGAKPEGWPTSGAGGGQAPSGARVPDEASFAHF